MQAPYFINACNFNENHLFDNRSQYIFGHDGANHNKYYASHLDDIGLIHRSANEENAAN